MHEGAGLLPENGVESALDIYGCPPMRCESSGILSKKELDISYGLEDLSHAVNFETESRTLFRSSFEA